mmetsp:Transcript_31364/g.32545  ORF Transcript_31364/g.32545 Transcript_31364/m.32545 type:complete len:191 (-) Transcript_31364:141-713(-)
MGMSIGGSDFKKTFFKRKDGDIESSSSQVEDKNVSFSLELLIKTVSNSSSSGFIDDSKNVKSGNGSSILSGESLRVIEVSRDSNNSVLNISSNEIFSYLFHLLEDHSRNFLSEEFLGLSTLSDNNLGSVSSFFLLYLERPELNIFLDNRVIKLSTNKSLSIEDSVGGVSCDLVFSSISNKSFSSFGESNI